MITIKNQDYLNIHGDKKWWQFWKKEPVLQTTTFELGTLVFDDKGKFIAYEAPIDGKGQV